MLEFLKNIDREIFLLLNGLNNDFWDIIMWHLSGKMIWVPLYLFLIFLIIRKYKKTSWIFIVAAILTASLTDLTSVHLFKEVFQRLRPCHAPELEGLVHIVNGKCGGSFGFVSSHAANTFGLATLIAFIKPWKKAWATYLILLWAAIISYSRIYLGVHYPADVFGGTILGAGIGSLTAFIALKLNARFGS